MYCSACQCEFVGLKGQCPNCRSSLIDTASPLTGARVSGPPDGRLLELVRRNGGRVEITMVTTDIGHFRTFSFPYIGRGFGWERRMQGCFEDLTLELEATEVAIKREWRLFYRGYGYAWARRMQGHIAGHPIALITDDVGMKSGWMFPYFGYGYAWVKSMTGTCGDQMTASFRTTNVVQKKESRFPYFGFGYAWADKGVLTLALKEA